MLARKYQARVEVTGSDKPSSLSSRTQKVLYVSSVVFNVENFRQQRMFVRVATKFFRSNVSLLENAVVKHFMIGILRRRRFEELHSDHL
jgi:hypothetical protein